MSLPRDHNSSAERAGPLKDLLVIDLTGALAGPYCTQILADLGADVIKVEAAAGDTTRFLGAGRAADQSGIFANLNRGKRSMALDLKHPDGRAVLMRLVDGADVFIHSMRRPAVQRLGLAYPDVKATNEKIVYGALSGFGRGGPYGNLPAYDDVIQAASGLAMLQGEGSGGEPAYLATVVADKVAGLTAAYAVVSALFHRERSGEGQEVEVPLFETAASFVMAEHIGGAAFEPPLGRPVYSRVVSKDRRPYQTSDGYLAVMIYNDSHWERFFAALGNPEWTRDERFASMSSRTENIDFVLATVSRVLAGASTAAWLDVLRAADIPAMPLQSTDDLLTDPHLEAVGFWTRVDSGGQEYRFAGIPTKFSRTPGRITGSGPGLAEHGREVLVEHGFSVAEIEDLHTRGIVAEATAADAASQRLA